MSSLTLRPPALFLNLKSCLSASPSSSFSSPSCSLSLVSRGSNLQLNCPRKTAYRERLVLRAQSFDSSSSGETGNESDPNAADFKPTNGAFKSRKEILLEYVQNVQPEFMEVFAKRAPMQVVDAMRQTVANMIGTLPEQFFAVTVTTVAENLAQLMYGVLMTGYMFRNAQFRLELQQSLEQVALPEPKEKPDAPEFAPGTQKKVTGEVIRWNNVSGPEKLDAVKYIELLEAEIQELTRQLERKPTDESNDLMDYLRTLEPENLKELTSTAGEDVILAMNTFIKRLLAVSDPSDMKTRITEASAPELGKLLYWLMVVGYSIRNIEVRFDMERILGTPPKLAKLPPGENL